MLKALDTCGNFKTSSHGVSQHMHPIHMCENSDSNWSSKLQENNERAQLVFEQYFGVLKQFSSV